jgi:methionyl-tRNA formyltransferase
MKRIIVVGNDKIGGQALKVLSSLQKTNETFFCVDRSTNIKRLANLIKRGSISPRLVVKMLFCEIIRPGEKPPITMPSIMNNKELVELIKARRPKEVILFRAGLIINANVLAQGVKILNLHCSRLPDYGGIGTIARALKDQEYEQAACLHIVTKRIDDGQVIKMMPYQLDPLSTYCLNERNAYNAGIQLLEEYLS